MVQDQNQHCNFDFKKLTYYENFLILMWPADFFKYENCSIYIFFWCEWFSSRWKFQHLQKNINKYDQTLFGCFLKLSLSNYLFCHCSKLWNVDVDSFDWSIPVKLLNGNIIGVYTRLPVGAENRKQCLKFLSVEKQWQKFLSLKNNVINFSQWKSSGWNF